MITENDKRKKLKGIVVELKREVTGDIGAVVMTINSIPKVIEARPLAFDNERYICHIDDSIGLSFSADVSDIYGLV